MKIEDKVIELISFNKFKEMQMLEDVIGELYPPVYDYENLHMLKELTMNKIITEKIIDRKFFICKYDTVSAFKIGSKPIPKEEQYVVDIFHTYIFDDRVFLTICNNIDFSKVRQKSLKLYTEDRRLSYSTYPLDNLVDYTARTARGHTTVIRVIAEKNLIPLLPFLTKIEFVPIEETVSSD